MAIDSSDLIQVNAIIISGLIVLLTFQSFSSPLYEKQIIDTVDSIRDISISINKTKSLLHDYCNGSQSNSSDLKNVNSNDLTKKCEEWQFTLAESRKEGNAWTNIGQSFHTFNNTGPGSFSKSVVYSMWGGTAFKIITIIMIIPFAVSTICEIDRKRNSDTLPSKGGIFFLTLGFIFIIGGFSIMAGITYCASPYASPHSCPV